MCLLFSPQNDLTNSISCTHRDLSSMRFVCWVDLNKYALSVFTVDCVRKYLTYLATTSKTACIIFQQSMKKHGWDLDSKKPLIK